MMDNGYPLCTETNVLKEIVKPPSLLNKTIGSVIPSGMNLNLGNLGNTSYGDQDSASATTQQSSIPWRKTKVWYPTNDIYVDVVETMSCIIDRNNQTVVNEVSGTIKCNSKLSGTPDLLLCFENWRLMQDIGFHPCVRLKKWEQEKVVSFIPPDGRFILATYKSSSIDTGIYMYVCMYVCVCVCVYAQLEWNGLPLNFNKHDASSR